jgi:hypothetical protein
MLGLVIVYISVKLYNLVWLLLRKRNTLIVTCFSMLLIMTIPYLVEE